MKTNTWNLPDEVLEVVGGYYASPIKAGLDGQSQDIRLFSLSRDESLTLAQLVYAHCPNSSLDIGLGAASSSIAIAAARKQRGLSSKHITLDPFQQTRSSSVGLVEILKAGMQDYIEWVPERSEAFFSSAVGRNEKYDLVFVDGGHDIGQTVTDTFYIHRVLNPGGLVIFHDALLLSTSVAVRYLLLECKYRLLSLKPDSRVKRIARIIYYTPSLGIWYATTVIPRIYRSLVALERLE